MKAITKQLLAAVNNHHDWQNHGIRGGGGTRYSELSTCRVCGLDRYWLRDRQNGIEDQYTFTREGQEISLAEAAQIQCCQHSEP